ncbi:MAG: FAD-dependent oxidoreductase [Rhodospirillales bacterium]
MSGHAVPVGIGRRFAPLLEGWEDVVSVAERGLGPLLDLAVRLWLAQIFFVSGVLKTTNWDATVFLYTHEHPVPGLDPAVAAVIGTGIELVCPVLLAFGLASRIAAIPLLLTTAFLQLTYKELADHLYWAALLGFLLLRGPGALSVDHFIAPHLAGSAIPFAGSLKKLAVRLHRHVLPSYQFTVRVWLAWLIWDLGFRDGSGSEPWQAMGLVLCAVLAAGLATRSAALFLALLSTTSLSDVTALGDPVLRLFLLATFALHGAGPISVDRLLRPYVHRLCPSLSRDPGWLAEAPRVIIVGAGFAGIAAAQALRHAWARITLVDRRNYHLFQPLLYQVATATLSPADIAVPIRTLVRGQQNCRVLMGRVSGVDVQGREVVVGNQRIPYDYLVLATGARHSYFGKDEWEPFAPGLKKIDDATAVRSRVLSAFERAEAAEDDAERQRLLTFVLVGGGPTGVELAGAIAELARQSLREEFRTADPTSARILLIQSAPRILPSLPEGLSLAATRSLRELGVEVLTNSRVEQVDDGGVNVGNRRIEARTVLWTAGVMASAAGRWIGAERDAAGRILVEPDLSVPGVHNVFAIGDTAACHGADGRPLPGLAAVAKQQGHYVSRVIRARIEGREHHRRFRYRDLGSMATIGRKAAVADLRGVRLSGSLAWWLWGLVHVAFLVDLRSRIAVMFDWFWSYLTYNRSMRLITGVEGDRD